MVKLTPPMGWNTWNTFGKNINEELILSTAETLVKEGYLSAGYNYVIIDDAWSLRERDKNGNLVPDSEKFPHGIKFLADKLHSMGLKIGIYSCAACLTCEAYPGSFEHEWQDAEQFNEWGIDYLKYDFCYKPNTVPADILYKRMSVALNNQPRDIVLAACSWGIDGTHNFMGETTASTFRSTYDIKDNFESIKKIALSQIPFAEYGGMGCFNDLDMLTVGMNGKGYMGKGGCTEDEYKLHFAFWAIFGSPLIIGADIRSIDKKSKDILLNKDIIAVNQDKAARKPFAVNGKSNEINQNKGENEPYYNALHYGGDKPVIAKYLENGDIALGFFNFSDTAIGTFDTAVTLDSLGIPITSGKTLKIKNLFTGEEISGPINRMIFLENLNPHSCEIYRCSIVDVK